MKKAKLPVSVSYIQKCLNEVLSKINDNRINSIFLFGSYAKGIATASSDVDLFVDVDEGFSLFDLASLQIELEKVLGKKVDLATKKDDEYFINVISRDAIKLYERKS